MKTYLEATDAAGARLFQRGITGRVTMLNLLRLRDVADYSAHPELAPAEPITGRQAYQLYIGHRTAAAWDSRILPLVDQKLA